MPPFDLIFVNLGESDTEELRLRTILESQLEIGSVLLATRSVEGIPLEISALMNTRGMTPNVFCADDLVSASNRALLFSSADIVLTYEGLIDVPGALSELVNVAEAFDRAGAVFPSSQDTALSGQTARELLHDSCLPLATEAVVPDVGTVLLKRKVLNMVGGLDSNLPTLPEALADWCLRAQRLGFSTLRAHHSLIKARRKDRDVLALPPWMDRLQSRHPYFDMQQRAPEDAFPAKLTAHALAARDGRISVGLDIRYLPEGAINGTGVYALELCRALMRYTASKLQLWVETAAQARAVESLEVPVVRGAQPPRGVQVIHRPAQVFLPEHLPGLLAADAPLVITFQDLIAWRVGSAFARPIDHQRYRQTSHLTVRSAQAVIAISDHNRDELIREFHLPKETVHTVHHGVDATTFPPLSCAERAEALDPLRLPKSFFLNIGSDYAHKNLRLLLAAYAGLRSEWPDNNPPGLVLVGHPSGTIDGVYGALRESAPLGVHYLGGVSNTVRAALYQTALATVYLSAYEGFGLPLLEAMAAGCPVVSSDLSSIPEVGGDAPLYVREMSPSEVTGCMLRLGTDESLRKTLVARGRVRVAQFTWAQTAAKTFAVYQEAIMRPPLASIFERKIFTSLCLR